MSRAFMRVTYFLEVKPRFARWLLTALLVLAGCPGVPTPRMEVGRAAQAIVWIAEGRSAKPEVAEQLFAVARAPD